MSGLHSLHDAGIAGSLCQVSLSLSLSPTLREAKLWAGNSPVPAKCQFGDLSPQTSLAWRPRWEGKGRSPIHVAPESIYFSLLQVIFIGQWRLDPNHQHPSPCPMLFFFFFSTVTHHVCRFSIIFLLPGAREARAGCDACASPLAK